MGRILKEVLSTVLLLACFLGLNLQFGLLYHLMLHLYYCVKQIAEELLSLLEMCSKCLMVIQA
nr:hypothetical protein Iba_chr14aCG11140 [Ipomoea batatas]GMD87423.1 hypothetical protein Iba_chr14bCG15590 [Ipomoea batatas]GMD90157.1 hypothetical protein Iba_chr14dCG6960 [Ipomoea batatas]